MGTTLDTASIKKPHKFFETYVDNDTVDLFNYLSKLNYEIVVNNICNIPEKVFSSYPNKKMGLATIFGIDYYNIFHFPNEGIYNLFKSLKELTKEACEYYNIDFEKEKYLIHGWFNLDEKTHLFNTEGTGGVNPIKNPNHFHDHSNGHGIPWFHGYYCVNAEPSSTFYKIDNDDSKIFENINKNNRAIISETGHPHGRDDWFDNKPRITIAYDITPLNKVRKEGLFVPLV